MPANMKAVNSAESTDLNRSMPWRHMARHVYLCITGTFLCPLACVCKHGIVEAMADFEKVWNILVTTWNPKKAPPKTQMVEVEGDQVTETNILLGQPDGQASKRRCDRCGQL
jgi:hypothetical protein